MKSTRRVIFFSLLSMVISRGNVVSEVQGKGWKPGS
jgi:hypothetical protein